MSKAKLCLYCEKPIVGRSDKKFCDDQCRNSYNNQLNSDGNNYVRNINNALRKNRRIMEELNPDGKITIPKSKLVEQGFNFKYFTHLYKSSNDKVYYFCYEHGYMALDGDRYLLVIRDNDR